MVTFATSTPDQQAVEIDQRIVQTGETGLGGVISAITDTASTGIDIVTSVLADDATRKAIKAGQLDVDATQADMDRLGVLQSNENPILIKDIEEEQSLLARGVKAGKIKRETAMMLTANSVKKAIDENPLLTNKIREASQRFLGFTPESLQVQQFFQAFDTDAQLRAQSAKGVKETAWQKMVSNGLSMGLSQQVSEDQATLTTDLNNQVANISALSTIGNFNAQQQFRALEGVGEIEHQQGIVGRIVRAANEGIDINQTFIQRELDILRDSSWGRTKTMLLSGKNAPDVGTLAAMRIEHAAKFERTASTLSTFDKSAFQKENIEDFNLAAKLYTNKAFTAISAFNQGLGPRAASSFLDLIKEAEGNPALMKVLLTTDKTGTMAPLLKSFNQGSDAFYKTMLEGAQVLSDPNATRSNMTPENVAVADFIAKEVMVTAEPEERSIFAKKLNDKGFPVKAASLLLKGGRSGLSPEAVSIVKSEWDLSQATVPQSIVDAMAGNNDFPGLKDGVTIEASPDGKQIQAIVRTIGDIRGVSASDTQYNTLTEKLNMFLRSMTDGFGDALGNTNVEKYVSDTVSFINKGLDEKLKAKQAFQQLRGTRSTLGGEGRTLTQAQFEEAEANKISPEAQAKAEAAVDALTSEQLKALIAKGARVRGK